jgi:hypothetical protein
MLAHLRNLGALDRLDRAATIIEQSGLCPNMYLHPYNGTISATGALLRAFDVSDKIIASWDGDVMTLKLPDMQFALFNELYRLLELVVDADLDTWNDEATAEDVIRAYRRLRHLIEFANTK